ncbi:hypothetical protein ACFQ0O_18705 [Saccharopolyspora spinosporotrichia]
MDPILAADLERFPELLADARDRAVRALAGLATRPVGVPPTMPEPAALPVEESARRAPRRASTSAGSRASPAAPGPATWASSPAGPRPRPSWATGSPAPTTRTP